MGNLLARNGIEQTHSFAMASNVNFTERCGLNDSHRQNAIEAVARKIAENQIELIRFAWCDLHGNVRGKTLAAKAALKALHDGLGMVSTLMLKDTSDRTAYPVFEEGGVANLPGFECASNLLLVADPHSYRQLPWAAHTGWVQCQPWFQNAAPVTIDTRYLLQKALAQLAEQGYAMTCGLEVELHVYRIEPDSHYLDPEGAAWPGSPPKVSMVHPGYNVLSERWADLSDEPLRIIQHTAQALGLPLVSLEIELGPSQIEAVFQPTDAMTAADNMVLFRSAVTQALARAGFHATFMCRPPFAHIMSSGWHLHQSLIDATNGQNLFMRQTPLANTTASDAQFTLTEVGEHYLAGLLVHAKAMAALATPTINGFERFRPNALAPQSILWGVDNRGAMLRVIGASGDSATRIENRIGEPAANPYLYIASQVYAGLDGINQKMPSPKASRSPYGDSEGDKLPSSLAEALEALKNDPVMRAGFGNDFIHYFCQIKQQEINRWQQADDKTEWQRREYFGRF
jgi:glutamine synthetase